jgi:hypothetical protein
VATGGGLDVSVGIVVGITVGEAGGDVGCVIDSAVDVAANDVGVTTTTLGGVDAVQALTQNSKMSALNTW